MEFYLSFDELLGKTASPVTLIFLPIFLITTLIEGLLIWHRQGTFPWKNAGSRQAWRSATSSPKRQRVA